MGSYFLAVNLVEMITMLTYSLLYCCITFYSSGQFDEDNRFLWYFYIMTLVLFCTQSLSSCVGIVFQKNIQFALFASIAFVSLIFLCMDFLFRVSNMPIPLRLISEISFPKFMFTSVMIIIYGLNRCESHQISYVLHQFNIEGNETNFWNNLNRLIIILVGIKVFEFGLLWIKSSRLSFEFNFIKKFLNINETDSNSNICDDNNVVSIAIIDTEFDWTDHQNVEIMLVWSDLTFKVNRFNQDEITILDNLNGFVTIGSLNAVMGPSGAGKTTLIKCLMSDKIAKNLDKDAKILVNSKEFRKTCFIRQNDSQYLIKDLTVWQTLLYASQLKNSNEAAKVSHKLMATNLMNELLILEVKDTKVGKCSGGQQKRIVIACELMACIRPDLLCIDEPTTGLDSSSAQKVLFLLR